MENMRALDGRFVLAWDSLTVLIQDPTRGTRTLVIPGFHDGLV